MKLSEKRNAGSKLRRDGISKRIIELAESIANGSYKNAIEKAGQIFVLVEAASFDSYWEEKARTGKLREETILSILNDKGTIE